MSSARPSRRSNGQGSMFPNTDGQSPARRTIAARQSESKQDETRLNYNRTSGHVKLNGAVVGRIDEEALMYVPFKFAPLAIEADDLSSLLKQVREALT